jgi:hypothetical protein
MCGTHFMADVQYLARLQKAIRSQHGCDSRHLSSIPVHLAFKGQTIWDGIIEFFSVAGHPKAKECYAWASLLETGRKSETFFAVLCSPQISTPMAAVRSVLAKELEPKPTSGKIYKVMAFSMQSGKPGLIESDLIFEADGKRAQLVLEWWPNTGSGDVPKTTIEIEPAFLQRVSGQNMKCDFFYRGQIPIPAPEDN